MTPVLSAVTNFGQLSAKKTIANAFAVVQNDRLDTLRLQARVPGDLSIVVKLLLIHSQVV